MLAAPDPTVIFWRSEAPPAGSTVWKTGDSSLSATSGALQGALSVSGWITSTPRTVWRGRLVLELGKQRRASRWDQTYSVGRIFGHTGAQMNANARAFTQRYRRQGGIPRKRLICPDETHERRTRRCAGGIVSAVTRTQQKLRDKISWTLGHVRPFVSYLVSSMKYS